MRSRLGLAEIVALGFAVGAHLGGCFDFDATMAGGPLEDSGAFDARLPPPDVNDAASDAAQAAEDAGGDGSNGSVTDGSNDGAACVSDAVAPPWDGASAFCASQQVRCARIFLCDDFDEGKFPAKWTTYGETNGTLLVTDAASRSPPDSLDQKTNALSDGGLIDVSVRAQFPTVSPPSTLRLAFSLLPLHVDPTENAAIVLGAIDFLDAAGDRYTVSLAINTKSGAPTVVLAVQAALGDGGGGFTNYLLPSDANNPMTVGSWSDLAIVVSWTSATAATGVVTMNGSQEISEPLTIPFQPTTLQVGIGTAYESQPSPGWELGFDNALFTAQ